MVEVDVYNPTRINTCCAYVLVLEGLFVGITFCKVETANINFGLRDKYFDDIVILFLPKSDGGPH